VAMLEIAAAAIRPDQAFQGSLSRLEDGDFQVITAGRKVADATAGPYCPLAAASVVPPQSSMAFAGTEWWDDLAAPGAPHGNALSGWRSAISRQFSVGDERYVLTFASAQPMAQAFGEDDLAYVEVLAEWFGKQLLLQRLDESLRDRETRARQHAQRVGDVLKLVNDSNVDEKDLWVAMLAHAARTLIPGQEFDVILGRIEGSDISIEAIVESPANAPRPGTAERSLGGLVTPLSGTLVGIVCDEGERTHAWEDIARAPDVNAQTTLNLGLRAAALTKFAAGNATWFLSFYARSPAARPFSDEDKLFVEMLGSFFANHVQKSWVADRLAHQQTHDALTGLANRASFRARATVALASGVPYAVVNVDVDGFSQVNETYGHKVGDALLVEIASALQRRAGEAEILARVAGDVFSVLTPAAAGRDAVRARALELAAIFSERFSIGDGLGREFVSATATLGIAVAPEDGNTIDALMSHADTAIAKAAERGQRGTPLFYDAEMDGSQRSAARRSEIVNGISENQFTLHYQPHLDLRTGAIAGCEALIRWRHPERGLLSPAQFIPFAESDGLIASIDRWVMRSAFAAASELRELYPGLRVYFNVSGRLAGDEGLVELFEEFVRDGFTFDNIGVEITETDAMRDIEATQRNCHMLRRLGVRTALDDFGTGYSSLSALKHLPLDIVKIDRTFIADLLTDRHDRAIAEATISIASQFGFESLAEGVETQEQLDWLREHGCGYVQGFGICHPLPLGELKTWLSARSLGDGSLDAA